MHPLIRSKIAVVRLGCAVFALLPLGCGSSEHNLLGTWEYRGGLSQLPAAAEGPPPAEPLDSQPLDSQPPGITLQFSRGGKLKTETRQGAIHSVKEGTWNWLHYDPAQHLGAIQCRLLGQKTDHRIEFLGPDTIRLNPPNLAGIEQQLQFQRVR